MKYLIKRCHFGVSRSQILCLSTFTRSSKTQKTNLKKLPETNSIGSLFNEITEILGGDNVFPDRISHEISVSEETHVHSSLVSEEKPSGTQGVRRNAEEEMMKEKEKMLISKDTQLSTLDSIDVNPIIHSITEIVRAENDAISMEERLEKSGFQFDSEIVEKVLKRCFKVPHLAVRFFHWLKLNGGFCHTTETYNTMLYIAGEAKEFQLVQKLMQDMEKNSCEKDIKTWTIIILLYGKAKLIGKALWIFEQMRKCGCEPDAATYKTMIHSLCMAGKVDIATEFYKEMVQKNMNLDINVYKMLLTCKARSDDITGVHSVADDMMRVSQIPPQYVYGCVLKSLCIAGRIKDALELIRDLKSKHITLDPEYFEILVKGLCRADRIADALDVVEIMKEKQFVDGKIYGSIINGYLRSNDVAEALDLYQSLKESGHFLMTSSYTELMQHLFQRNEYQKGCELYNEMLERRINLDCVAITAMVAGHIHQNNISEAWKVFNTMKDEGIRPTWKSYMVFIKELCKVSQTDEIFDVLNEMRASKIRIRDEIFHWVISYMENKGEMNNLKKIKDMQRIYDLRPQEGELSSNNSSRGVELNMELNFDLLEAGKMKTQTVEPLSKAYSDQDVQNICRMLSSSTDWCLVQDTLEKSTAQFTPELVVEILRNCSMNGCAALKFFSWVQKKGGYNHTAETYNIAIKIAGTGKDFKHMRNLFFEMKREGYNITPDTWTIMIMQYGRAGLTEIALRNFNEMKASGCSPTFGTYKYLIILLCGRKGRKVDEAIKLFQEMIRAGHIPDKELVETHLGCLCEVGKLSDARKCTDTLRKVGYTIPLSYSLYIRALCRAGKLEEALALLDEAGAERTTLDNYTYGSLVHGLLRQGRLEDALAKVDSMKQAGIYPTVHVYTSLIVHFFKEKQIEKALETFKAMQQDGCEPTVVTYSALIRGYMNNEKANDAWNVFHQMKLNGPSPDFKTYSMFITCLCNVGKSEEAVQLITEMSDNGIVPSTVNFRTVFYGLNREGLVESWWERMGLEV